MTKGIIPLSSILNSNEKFDYSDSYSDELETNGKEIKIEDIANAFFSSAPIWVHLLFSLRNKLVSLIGLKTSGDEKSQKELLEKLKWQAGEKVGLFRIYSRTTNEIILGEDDKHLNFRVSLFLETVSKEHSRITISTVVKFHNWMGKLYFFPVKPFHQLIVPVMLKGILKELGNESKR